MNNTLKQTLENQGYLLQFFLGNHEKVNTIEILRVYPYESNVGGVFFSSERKYVEKDPESIPILAIIDQIRNKCKEEHWNDNKIVVELYIGYSHIFIGFWDEFIRIGNSVIPNPTRNPHYKTNDLGNVEPVTIRE